MMHRILTWSILALQSNLTAFFQFIYYFHSIYEDMTWKSISGSWRQIYLSKNPVTNSWETVYFEWCLIMPDACVTVDENVWLSWASKLSRHCWFIVSNVTPWQASNWMYYSESISLTRHNYSSIPKLRDFSQQALFRFKCLFLYDIKFCISPVCIEKTIACQWTSYFKIGKNKLKGKKLESRVCKWIISYHIISCTWIIWFNDKDAYIKRCCVHRFLMFERITRTCRNNLRHTSQTVFYSPDCDDV